MAVDCAIVVPSLGLAPVCSSPFLRETDELSIVTFNHEVNAAMQDTLKSLDWRSFREEMRAGG